MREFFHDVYIEPFTDSPVIGDILFGTLMWGLTAFLLFYIGYCIIFL